MLSNNLASIKKQIVITFRIAESFAKGIPENGEFAFKSGSWLPDNL